MDASRKAFRDRAVPLVAVVCSVVILFWFFPPFRIVALDSTSRGTRTSGVTFDAAVAALQIWNTDLRAAADGAEELASFAGLLRDHPLDARERHAHSAGLGAAYYFVRGTGRVVAQDHTTVRVILAGAVPVVVALRIGPVFGNTVRDGCGRLDVNAFPGLREFNALSAELNALVEKNVLPVLREKASVGATVQFAGCAEAPESPAAAGAPLLTIIPVRAEVL